MTISSEAIRHVLDLVKFYYPGWNTVDHPPFVAEEIDYKRDAADKASGLLDRDTIEQRISTEDWEDLLARLKKVVRATNLLYLGTPQKGDARLLHMPEVDKKTLCEQVFDLLYGEGDDAVRFGRFIDYERSLGLSPKWTFASYLLFFRFPESNFFVKPTATARFLDLLGNPFELGDAGEETYRRLLDLGKSLLDELDTYGARDMIDVQSVLWVADHAKEGPWDDFWGLFDEFAAGYAATEGENWLTSYRSSGEQAKSNLQQVRSAKADGQDITDLVLRKLLPHARTPTSESFNAWICIAPAINGDVKKWFESAGWTKPEDWPKVSQAILHFYETCLEDPEALEEACRQFSELEYSKGFQAGMLSPLLNAIESDRFMLVNRNSILVLNHFTYADHSAQLTDYPRINQDSRKFSGQVAEEMRRRFDDSAFSDAERFDMFCHWLVAEKKYLPRPTKMASPFSDIFESWEEADWALDFLAEAMRLMGIEHPKDPRVAITVPLYRDGKVLRLNVGQWLVLDFWSRDYRTPGVHLLLISDRVEREPTWPDCFANSRKAGEPAMGIHIYSYEEVKDMSDELRAAFEASYKLVGEHYKEWKGTAFSPTHIQPIFDAVFDRDTRAKLFSKGIELKPAFRQKAFELLAGLRESPTKEYYDANKKDFDKFVKQPFKDLMALVAKRVDPVIQETMETEKSLFGRITKNDYGRGGAWPFYWGAFYPEGSKRTEDAQLIVWMNGSDFDFGFYIADDATAAKKKLTVQLPSVSDLILEGAEKMTHYDTLEFGPSVSEEGSCNAASLEEWMADPAACKFRVRRRISTSELTDFNIDGLADEIAETFDRLYPLVIAATVDEPRKPIEEYLNGTLPPPPPPPPEYTLKQCAEETGFSEIELEQWIWAITRKGQGVLYGPPGTGKTYVAKRLARHLIGGEYGFMRTVQFHPAYTYEEFIQGIRPKEKNGVLTYPTVDGTLVNFCREAEQCDGTCVLIIDEINRANLSRVFGELMYLLEYRDEEISLASGDPFKIPNNVVLIGTMNTADRSIALVDHALRRRFAFIPLYPNYTILERFHAANGTKLNLSGLKNVLFDLNKEIDDRNYEIGVSFFLDEDLEKHISGIWKMEIEPYLEEYFFDQSAKADKFRWEQVAERIGFGR